MDRGRQRRAAYYTNIPPGSYRFRVLAANNDGVWNTEGRAIRVPPAALTITRPAGLSALLALLLLGS